MKDQLIDPTIGIFFTMDYNPNDILVTQAQELWYSISEDQHMRDHEIMLRNIQELAKEDLKLMQISQSKKN